MLCVYITQCQTLEGFWEDLKVPMQTLAYDLGSHKLSNYPTPDSLTFALPACLHNLHAPGHANTGGHFNIINECYFYGS